MKKVIKALEKIEINTPKITKKQQKELKGGDYIVTEDLVDG